MKKLIEMTNGGEEISKRFSIENYLIVWLDSNTDISLNQLRRFVNTIQLFSDAQQAIDFVNNIKNERIFFFLSDSSLVSNIDHLPQIQSISILPMSIDEICDKLKEEIQQFDRNSISIHVTSTDENHLNESFFYSQFLQDMLLDCNYDYYTKNQFIEFCRQQYENNIEQLKSIDEFDRDYHSHCPFWWYNRKDFAYKMLNRALRLQDIEVLNRMAFFICDIHRNIEEIHSQIHSFTVYRGQALTFEQFDMIKQNANGYLMFNSFLSTHLDRDISLSSTKITSNSIAVLFDIEINPLTPFIYFENEQEIFFSIRSIFQIKQIIQHDEQISTIQLKLIDINDDEQFKQLTKHFRKDAPQSRLGSLVIQMERFKNFEESFDKLVAESNNQNDENLSSICHQLASIKFSMNEYQQAIEYNELALELDDRFETLIQLGKAYFHTEQYSQALDCFEKSLNTEKKPTHLDTVHTYKHLGDVYAHMGEFEKALGFYQKSFQFGRIFLRSNPTTEIDDELDEYTKALQRHNHTLHIQRKSLPDIHPEFGNTFNNIGEVYLNLGEYSKALEFYKKSVDIRRHSVSQDDLELCQTFNRIGEAYLKMENYEKALEFFRKALTFAAYSQSIVATIHQNIAETYQYLEDYQKAFQFYEKTLQIRRRFLPKYQPESAIADKDSVEKVFDFYRTSLVNQQESLAVLSNIAEIHLHLGESTKALEIYEKISSSISLNQLELAQTLNSIAGIHHDLGQYVKAVEIYEKSLDIRQKSLPRNHPDLIVSYNNLAGVHNDLSHYSKALEFYEIALDIAKICLPTDHLDLAPIYNNLGLVYVSKGKYFRALHFYQMSFDIAQKWLPLNHPELAITLSLIGQVYHLIGDYSTAIEFYQMTLQIRQQSLPENHPHLALTYNNLATVYHDLKHYSKALQLYQKALEIQEKILPAHHPDLAIIFNNLGLLYCNKEQYFNALDYFEKTFEICQKILPENHLEFATIFNNVALVYDEMNQHRKSIHFYEKALQIQQTLLPANHPDLASIYNNVAGTYHAIHESQKAIECYQRACQIAEQSLPRTHPLYQKYQYDLLHFQSEQSKLE